MFSDADETNPESWDFKPRNVELKSKIIRRKIKRSLERRPVLVENSEKEQVSFVETKAERPDRWYKTNKHEIFPGCRCNRCSPKQSPKGTLAHIIHQKSVSPKSIKQKKKKSKKTDITRDKNIPDSDIDPSVVDVKVVLGNEKESINDDDEELEEKYFNGKKYYISNKNGIVYDVDEDDSPGIEVGSIKNGIIKIW